MRIMCPYCEKVIAVYPIPTRQAIRHRRAGIAALVAQMLLGFFIFAVLGDELIRNLTARMTYLFTPRIGMGLTAALLGCPFLFFGLAVYDRLVPHFGRPAGDDLHCLKCGYILKGLREPRCPECGQSI
jgi:hypothetical protein